MLAISCTKKEIVPDDQESICITDRKSVDIKPDFYLQGTKIDFSKFNMTESTSLVAGYEPNKVLIFETDEELVAWAREKQDRSKFLKAHDKMKDLGQWAEQNGLIDNEKATQDYMKSMQMKSSIKVVSILYRDYDFSGDSYTVPGVPWPTLGRFNNEASSIEGVLSLTVLCDWTWFRGSKFYLASVPYTGIPNLGDYGFDDITSSVLF